MGWKMVETLNKVISFVVDLLTYFTAMAGCTQVNT